MSISQLLVSIAEKIQSVYALKDNKPYINSLEITDYRYFNQEGKRNALLEKLDTSNGINFYWFCYGATDLTTVDLNFSKSTTMYRAFYNCAALETVEHLDLTAISYASTGLSGMFTGCTALKNVTMKPNCLQANISFIDSAQLTDESIQSIIDGLKSNSGARKITLHSDVSAKLTDEQYLQIYNKGWEIG